MHRIFQVKASETVKDKLKLSQARQYFKEGKVHQVASISADIQVQPQIEENLPPWRSSIDPSASLTYMNFFTHQLEMLGKLSQLKAYEMPSHLKIKKAINKPGRVSTLAFKSQEFQKIRMSYVDCGPAFQVFNVLFEPNSALEIPLFAAELLSIGERHLLFIDFLPLFEEKEYKQKYIQPLSTTKSKYPELHQVVSTKHYEDTRFFSENMLYARSIGERLPEHISFSAFQDYLAHYFQLAQTTPLDARPERMEKVLNRQREFHVYKSQRDPSKAIFEAWFGKEWAAEFDRFIH